MNRIADVVVVGGGIQGVSAAYHLCEAGVKNVQLVEMDSLGSGTTAYTASWFVLQAHLAPNIQMSKYALNEFTNFPDKFGVDIDFRKIGSLSLNTAINDEETISLAKHQISLGVPLEIVKPSDLQDLLPFLNIEDLGMGLFCPEDGLVDASAILNTYAKKTANLGGKLSEGIKALDIKIANNKVAGVLTNQGFISTPIVINAAGIYDKLVAKWVGIDLPTIKAIRHTFLTKENEVLPANMPLVEVLNPEIIYVRREGRCASYSVGLDKVDSFMHSPNLIWAMEKYGAQLLHRMKQIAELEIVKCTAGIRSVPVIRTQNENGEELAHVGRSFPILGPVDGIEGYFNDCAWGGLGVAHSPAGGKILANFVTGMDHFLDVNPFLLSRYGEMP